MDHALTVMLITLAVTAVLMLGVWVLSLIRKDASIVDVFWGLGFVLIAAVCYTIAAGYSGRKLLVTSLTAVWGIRSFRPL